MKYAETLGDEAIYKDHHCAQVVVIKVDKRVPSKEVWDVTQVVKMSSEECSWHNITNQ